MARLNTFKKELHDGYACHGDYIQLGAAMLDGNVFQDLPVTVPLRSLNRHGLISGATGTGKTKTIQLLAEKLSEQGVPSLLMDLKGDLSGLAVDGEVNEKIKERQQKLGLSFHPEHYPVEFLSLSEDLGVKLRATISEFGPMLFSKMLGLNDTQTSIVVMLFKYCDDHGLLLLDLKDFKRVLNFALNEGKEALSQNYGHLSSSSVNAILRKMIELEQQGADAFFGEPSFEVDDLTRIDENGYGYISILRLTDLQDRPKLFSTFMLCLLAEIYAKFPEAGDLDKPKLVLFIDEAHLLFKNASKELLSQIESIVKLIRSKGVGIFFCTQNPTDVPDEVLGQLGMKVQHALRAFTAKDRKAIRLVAENYPESEFYETEDLLTMLGIGEALITALDEKGRPTPLVDALLCAPTSRMGPLTQSEASNVVQLSHIAKTYNTAIDRESAYELLNDKMQQSDNVIDFDKAGKRHSTTARKTTTKKQGSWAEDLSKNTMVRQVGRTIAREITRGLLGVLGIRKSRRR